MEKNIIPSLEKVHGHTRHCYKQYFCDCCGVDCTSKFFEIYVNEYSKDAWTTASNPFKQSKVVKKHICEACAETIGINILIK